MVLRKLYGLIPGQLTIPKEVGLGVDICPLDVAVVGEVTHGGQKVAAGRAALFGGLHMIADHLIIDDDGIRLLVGGYHVAVNHEGLARIFRDVVAGTGLAVSFHDVCLLSKDRRLLSRLCSLKKSIYIIAYLT